MCNLFILLNILSKYSYTPFHDYFNIRDIIFDVIANKPNLQDAYFNLYGDEWSCDNENQIEKAFNKIKQLSIHKKLYFTTKFAG